MISMSPRAEKRKGGFMHVKLKRTALVLVTICLASALWAAPAVAQASATSSTPTLTDEQAHAIAVDAYLYFYPLISVDITRKRSTNVEPGKAFGKGPMNMFVNVPAYPPADMKIVVRSTSTHCIPSRGSTSPKSR
jgi:hypothetical protein